MASYRKEVWLVDLLRRHPDIKFREIESYYMKDFNTDGLPQRTFHNIIDGITENHKVDIKCNGQRYRLEYPERVENDELLNLQISMFTMQNIVMDNMPEARCIDMDSVPSADERLNTVASAIKNRRRCRTFYRSCKHEDGYEVDFEPYGIKLHGNVWYVVCKSLRKEHQDSPLRTFRIDRMEDVDVLPKKFTLPKSFSIKEHFKGCIGVLRNDEVKPEPVIMRVRGWQRKYISQLPLHESQKFLGSGEDYDAYSYVLRPNSELVAAILRYGADVEVVSPKSLRDMVTAEIMKFAQNYGICLPQNGQGGQQQVAVYIDQKNNSDNRQDFEVNGENAHIYPNASKITHNWNK